MVSATNVGKYEQVVEEHSVMDTVRHKLCGL